MWIPKGALLIWGPALITGTTVFMNSRNSKTSDPYKLLLLNLLDKINLKRRDQYVALSNINIYYYTWKT